MCQLSSGGFSKKLCLAHLADLIPLVFDPEAALFRIYFDCWKKF